MKKAPFRGFLWSNLIIYRLHYPFGACGGATQGVAVKDHQACDVVNAHIHYVGNGCLNPHTAVVIWTEVVVTWHEIAQPHRYRYYFIAEVMFLGLVDILLEVVEIVLLIHDSSPSWRASACAFWRLRSTFSASSWRSLLCLLRYSA